MEHAVAYFDGAYGAVLASHMAEIRDFYRAKVVVYCVPEREVEFNRAGVIDAVRIIHQAGLKCFINFWAAYGIFGGEDYSGYLARGGQACSKNDAFRAHLSDLLALAAEAGADGVFWDEPEMKCRLEDNQVCCTTLAFLAEVTAEARALGLANEACIPPLPENWDLLDQVGALPCVDVLSTNAYYDITGYKHKYRLPHEHVTRWARHLADIGRRHGVETRMWLQGFKRVEMARYENVLMTSVIKITAVAARAGGITNFAIWAFRGCERLSSLWPNGRREQCAEVARAASEVFQFEDEVFILKPS